MEIRLFHVDSFSREPFRGNAAGVCLLGEPADEAWMQDVAAEVNHAATAFVELRDEGSFPLRWFTPSTEIALCGHGSLATAHVLWEHQGVPTRELAFETLSGTLSAKRTEDGWIALDFPVLAVRRADPPRTLAEVLGVAPRRVLRGDLDLVAELGSEEEVRTLKPDLPRMHELGVRAVIVTARASGRDYDFVSRVFEPSIGIPEDSVTGSAHCALGPFWADALGKRELLANQASPRGGYVRVRWTGGDRIEIAGQAVTVAAASLQPLAGRRARTATTT